MKLTKKQRIKTTRDARQLAIQVSRVQKIEDWLIENADPVECPVKYHFTDDNGGGLDMACREFLVPSGTILTGTIYKIQCFWVMVKGSMRLVEGDKSREIVAPCLLKNVVGQKNCGYAHEDCLFYGFWPNPDNSRDLETILNLFSALPANEIQGMPGNKQQLTFNKRLSGQINEKQISHS